ncbi:MAG: UvrD-helicase domain-containing protein [Magnetococcales bacterium]|nr:UvrD-helicase domain-containing protein [Magnetococcales bacterium]
MPWIDDQARTEALDVTRSFVVQAPAGSGKTGLLTQRILALLGEVGDPEEVVAITFTRKAAAEMKGRVLQALTQADGGCPEDSFGQKNWQLARRVLERDREHRWGLRDNPNRLRIMTIDALCHAIVRQLPVLTELGGRAELSEYPDFLYRQAARDTLDVFTVQHPWAWAVQRLFTHLDNDWGRIESMLAELLAHRDQWLRHVATGDDSTLRQRMDQTLRAWIGMELKALHAFFPEGVWPEVGAIMDFSGRMKSSGTGSASPWIGRMAPPGFDGVDVALWHELAATLLTSEGMWRRRWDVKTGFPPRSKAGSKQEGEQWETMKQRVAALVAQLEGQEETRDSLHRVRHLPLDPYSQEQWEILQALLMLLKVAAGHLMVGFAEHESVDHGEVTRRAIMALGSVDAPSDLALRLDHRLRHLLVDEFQDTSRVQFELLQRLVSGWEPGGGNTVFLVGDPMQSIYRFREAEVALFLQVQQQGIGTVLTESLFLEVNFRSVPGIVAWVNDTMPLVFPRVPRPETGAIPYKASSSSRKVSQDRAVELHACLDRDLEAQQAIALAAAARKAGASVCILARARSHLTHILNGLHEKKLRFQAVELYPLAGLPVIQDLLALTRALIHPADRIAWLAILRAPWCGLSLADLDVLGRWNPDVDMREVINHPGVDSCLSTSGRIVLSRVRPVLNRAWLERGRWEPFPGPGSLRRWVEATWRQLGGAATLPSIGHLESVEQFFALLEKLEVQGEPLDIDTLSDRVSTLYSGTDPDADPELVLMTIHKAKGLEFDCVIIPGLDRAPRFDEKRLLLWTDPPLQNEENSDGEGLAPLLAPIGRLDGDEEDPIYQLVRQMDREKSRHEVSRLLYVAVTRAKRQLHLLGLTQEEGSKPANGSFLAAVWPAVQEAFTQGNQTDYGSKASPPRRDRVGLRLHHAWQMPPLPPTVVAAPIRAVEAEDPIVFDWVGHESRLLGTVMHRFLALIASEGVAAWSLNRIEGSRKLFRRHLQEVGMSQRSIEGAQKLLVRGLGAAVSSGVGRWLLDGRHQDAQSEWGLTGDISERIVSVSIDRSFVDRKGVRWIVDYKTSQHEGGDRDEFLANERVRYRQQLHLYARLVSAMEDRPIHLGLYFPLMDAWLAWPWEGSHAGE